MEFYDIEAKRLDELTGLKETVESSQNKDYLFQLKREFLAIDEEMEEETFCNLHNLMKKAVGVHGARFEKGDFKLLDRYRYASWMIDSFDIGRYQTNKEDMKFEGIQRYDLPKSLMDMQNEIGKITGQLFIPVKSYRSLSGEIEFVDLSNFNIEINRRLFDHVYYVLIGQEKVKVCLAADCHRLFVPRIVGKTQIYCSVKCQRRQSKRDLRKRKQ